MGCDPVGEADIHNSSAVSGGCYWKAARPLCGLRLALFATASHTVPGARDNEVLLGPFVVIVCISCIVVRLFDVSFVCSHFVSLCGRFV